MKNIFFLLLIALLSSCDHLNKTILEPLSIEEINDEIEKDTLFSYFYEHIQNINKNSLDTDIKKAKYAKLTYRRVYNLFFYNDTTLYNKLFNEWKEKYSGYIEKVDSVSDYWERMKQEYSLEQYVKIELASISTQYYRYSGGIEDVIIGFKLIPLKGKVDQIEFSYSVTPKINSGDSGEKYISSMDRNWCLYSSPFSKEVTGSWKVGYSNENKLAGKTKDEVLRDYDLNIEIDKVRFNGENINKDDVEIPFSVRMYWEEGDSGSMKDYYSDEIIKEFIDKQYISSYQYVTNGFSERLKEMDGLAYDYLNLPTKTEINEK